MFSQFIVVLVCMMLTAFFAGIETGVISISRIRLMHHVEQKEPWAIVINDFLSHTDRLLGTTLVATNIFMIIASVLVASIGTHLLGAWGEAALGLALTLAVLVFCEYLPKAWFQSQPMARVAPFAKVLHLSWRIFRPLSQAVTWLTKWIVPELPGGADSRMTFVSKDELKVLAEEGEEHGVLSPKQRIMIHRVFELSARTAAQIMVPRAGIAAVSEDTTVDDFLRLAEQAHFTRFPVYRPDDKRFSGIVNLYDVLANQPADGAVRISGFMRPPQFIRDITPLTDILPRMRMCRMPMCLVTNAGSEVTGLITTQSIVEEIVGRQ